MIYNFSKIQKLSGFFVKNRPKLIFFKNDPLKAHIYGHFILEFSKKLNFQGFFIKILRNM